VQRFGKFLGVSVGGEQGSKLCFVVTGHDLNKFIVLVAPYLILLNSSCFCRAASARRPRLPLRGRRGFDDVALVSVLKIPDDLLNPPPFTFAFEKLVIVNSAALA
jgi:hypothetical protein